MVICDINDQYMKYVFASEGTQVVYLKLDFQLHLRVQPI